MQDSNLNFSEVYRRHAAYVSKKARSLGVASSEIDDVSQEVWSTVADKLAALDVSRPLEPWLYSVTFHHVMRRLRTGARAARKEQALADANRDGRTEAPQQRLDAGQAVERLLAGLSKHERDVILMCLGAGLTAREAAEVLKVTPSAVSNTLHNARLKCRRSARSLGLTAWVALIVEFCATSDPAPAPIDHVTAALVAELPSPRAPIVPSTGFAAMRPTRLLAVLAAAAAVIGLVWDPIDTSIERVQPPALEHAKEFEAPPPPPPPPSGIPYAFRHVADPPLPPYPELPRIPQDGSQHPERRKRVVATLRSTGTEPQRAPRSLKGHLTQIAKVKQALATGRTGEAFRLLFEHEQDFPDGTGADTRDLLRIQAHCLQRDEDRARVIARAHPNDLQFTPLVNSPCKHLGTY